MKILLNLFKASANKVGAAFFLILLLSAINCGQSQQVNSESQQINSSQSQQVNSESQQINSSQAQQINVGYMRDVSVSASAEAFDAKQTFKKVIGMLDLKDSKAGVRMSTSVIGAPGIPKVNVATLPRSEGYFSSVHERNKNLSRFLQKGMADFEYLEQPATHQRTEIFRSLVAMTDLFDPNADRTLLIIESDFISSGYVAEFFKYEDKPSALMNDFDKIIAAFRADSELPDLSGAEVILVTSGDSELAVWSARWWKRALILFGAKTVTVRATL